MAMTDLIFNTGTLVTIVFILIHAHVLGRVDGFALALGALGGLLARGGVAGCHVDDDGWGSRTLDSVLQLAGELMLLGANQEAIMTSMMEYS